MTPATPSKPAALIQRLRLLYIAALAIVALLSITGQWFVQQALTTLERDARIVNVAGRQRMLSQRIARLVLELSFEPVLAHSADPSPGSDRPPARLTMCNDLSNALEQWTDSHRGLQNGSIKLGLSGNNSQRIHQLFAVIDPEFEAIREAASKELQYTPDPTRSDSAASAQTVLELLERSDRFLIGMDSIVQIYELEAKTRVARLEAIERLLLVATLAVLLCEGLFIFTPAIRSLQRAFERLGRTQTELQQSRDLAEVSNRAKTDFLARMSHELRTPLHAILGMIRLSTKASSSPKFKKKMRVATRATRHLARLVDDLLDVSAIELGRALSIRPEPVNVGDLMGSVVKLMRPIAQAKSLTLKSRIDPKMQVMFEIDPVRTRQVWFNLIQNAIRYTIRGAVTCECSFEPSASPSSENVQGLLILSVRDTGIGIAKENQHRIFESFEQVPLPQQTIASLANHQAFGTGMGLGLTITASILKAMRGTISVESELGVGTTITVRIPTRVSSKSKSTGASTDSNRRASANQTPDRSGAPRSALVVDDSYTNRALLRAYLHRLGFQCVSAPGIQQASEMLRTANFDLIALDWHLVDGNGRQLLEQIDQRMQASAPHVLVITADPNVGPTIPNLATGAVSVLSKPLEFAELRDEIRKMGLVSESEREPLEQPSDQQRDFDALRQKLKLIVLGSLPSEVVAMSDCLKTTDYDMLAMLAHRTKGSCANAGLEELAAVSSQIETAATNREFEKCFELVTAIRSTVVSHETMLSKDSLVDTWDYNTS